MGKNAGRYLYCIVAEAKGRTYGAFGINGSDVYSVSDGKMAALVSDVPNQKIRPERRNIAAHQEVLKRLMAQGTVLPMSFGVIADSSDGILKILSLNQGVFLAQLKRVENKVEMGLRVSLDAPNLFDYFVQTHPEMRSERDRVFGVNREPSQGEKIELGQMFARILEEDRLFFTGMVEEILNPLCFEIKRNPPHNEHQIMNLACLIAKNAQSDFEAGVFKAAGLFDDNFAFDYNGPWAPHNFVEIDLKV
ncbi:MAG: GvpL/GvpF family gas vesicle protein [Candidatus Schekmanbacteria bacterium]|nr:GvpL/GvpF family gas vesicle protein [Candidatus Schekmanbacteria bacterium]